MILVDMQTILQCVFAGQKFKTCRVVISGLPWGSTTASDSKERSYLASLEQLQTRVLRRAEFLCRQRGMKQAALAGSHKAGLKRHSTIRRTHEQIIGPVYAVHTLLCKTTLFLIVSSQRPATTEVFYMISPNYCARPKMTRGLKRSELQALLFERQ
jgi:hypothetical protein